jgi:CheY-like chemotaxis protein
VRVARRTRGQVIDLTSRRARSAGVPAARGVAQFRAAAHLADPQGDASPRYLRGAVAHRSEWFRERLSTCLEVRGVAVIVADEVEVVGVPASVARPDLLIVEDRLTSLTGPEVIRRVRELMPGVLVAVQVDGQEHWQACLDAGADAVLPRALPPEDMADRLVELLRAGGRLG